jgi:hypothetical protein
VHSTIFHYGLFAAGGGLMSYGGSLTDLNNMIGVFPGRNSQRREARRRPAADEAQAGDQSQDRDRAPRR